MTVFTDTKSRPRHGEKINSENNRKTIADQVTICVVDPHLFHETRVHFMKTQAQHFSSIRNSDPAFHQCGPGSKLYRIRPHTKIIKKVFDSNIPLLIFEVAVKNQNKVTNVTKNVAETTILNGVGAKV